MSSIPKRQIRAIFDEKTIRVYQAYPIKIAELAVKHNTFVSPPFKLNRMTWIKPSFYWMMYRSGWGTKANQEKTLAIDITREGFEWALANASLSHYDQTTHKDIVSFKQNLKGNPVRIQWDPERDYNLNRLDYRSIQIGLSDEAVDLYINEWIVKITDITNIVNSIKTDVENKQLLLPETAYPLSENIKKLIKSES